MQRTNNSPSLPVACFAPPLTDELLDKYRAMIEVCPYGAETADILRTLLKCVEKWWELPESTRPDVTRWKLLHVDRKAEIDVVETPLEEAHIQELYEVTPWMRELEAMQPLVDRIEEAESVRNSVKLEQWQRSVRDTVLANSLTQEELAWLRSDERRMLREAMDTLARFGDAATPYIDPLVAVFSKDRHTAESIKALRYKVEDVDAKVRRIANGKEESPVARPALESVEYRNLAKALWWYAAELTLDREPMTRDKL